MKSLSFKQFLLKFKEDYLFNKLRTIELIFCIISNIILFIVQANSTFEIKAFISQMQGFIVVYLAFRFGFVGMVLSVISCVKDIFVIAINYLQHGNYSYLVGIIFTILNIVWVLIVGMISNRQEKHRQEMRKIAITDELTKVYNKRFLYSTLDTEIENSKGGNSIGLILIDIDNFRMYNDLYGLSYGDTILENTAAILKKIVDKNDTIYRFGGDEFAILMLNKDSDALEKEAKRIIEEYDELKKEYYNNGPTNKIKLSMGSSHYPSISKNKEDLISQANMALYQAKNMGDDKVHFYQDIMLQIHKDIRSDQQMIGVFKGLLSTIVTKDKYTFGHCERVSSYAVMISEAMGLNLKEIQTIKQAGLLHDIGKIELPKSVLNKIGRLTDEEFELIRQHPVYSANILEPLSGMDNLIDYVKHHHERYDGRGYPDCLAGQNISLGARILCVADSFDAMVSDRPYRKSMSIEEALKEIEKCSGSQFDPDVAKYFINAMRNQMSIKYNYNLENNELFQKGNTLHVR